MKQWFNKALLACHYALGAIVLFFTQAVYAAGPGDDPFPNIDIKGGDVVQAAGSQMETGMKYALVGGGVLMIIVGIGVIVHRLREDSSSRESGNFVTTMIMCAVAITVGIILIAIAWAATAYQAPT